MTALAIPDLPTLPPSVVAIVPGKLFAVGAGVAADVPVSWIRAGSSGFTPVQAYVFLSGGEALVLDCGLPAHAAELAAGFDILLRDHPPPRLLISRWEPDAMAGLPWLVARYRVPKILSYAGINPLDFFEGFEEAAAHSLVQAGAGTATLAPVLPGDLIDHGEMQIDVISPALRLLLTVWYYERTTRSLFTADAFGFLSNPSAPCPLVVRPDLSNVTTDLAREALLAKFDWLAGADSCAITADLEEMLHRFPIDRICPTIGGVIEGPQAVRRTFEVSIEALRALVREPRRSAIQGFDWSLTRSEQRRANE